MKNYTTTQKAENTATNASEILTALNLESISQRIAIKAVKTILAKSGHEHINRLYNGLIADINTPNDGKRNFSDGYDIVSETKTALFPYIGKRLDDIADGNEKDKDGNPITILRATFRAVNRYIMGERQRVYKVAYIDDVNENGERLFYEIPDGWDVPTITDYKRVKEIITALKLSANENRFLSYRLRGFPLDTIAQKMGVERGTINKYRQRIKAKAENIGLTANA